MPGNKPSSLFLLIIVSCGLLILGSFITEAAGETEIQIQPTNATGELNDTMKFRINVLSASDGIGSYDLEVKIGDVRVAKLINGSVSGSPEFYDVDISSGNSSVAISAIGMDVNDSGIVTIGTVTLRVVGDGETSVSLNTTALGDEAGKDYKIKSTRGAKLSISNRSDQRDDGNSGTTRTSTPTTEPSAPPPPPRPSPTPTSTIKDTRTVSPIPTTTLMPTATSIQTPNTASAPTTDQTATPTPSAKETQTAVSNSTDTTVATTGDDSMAFLFGLASVIGILLIIGAILIMILLY